MSHTYAVLTVPQEMFDFVERKLNDAQYDHAIDYSPEGKALDMHGIGLMADDSERMAPTVLERSMAEVLDKVKDWIATKPEAPDALELEINAMLLAYKLRRTE